MSASSMNQSDKDCLLKRILFQERFRQ